MCLYNSSAYSWHCRQKEITMQTNRQKALALRIKLNENQQDFNHLVELSKSKVFCAALEAGEKARLNYQYRRLEKEIEYTLALLEELKPKTNTTWRHKHGAVIDNVGSYLGSSATKEQKDRLVDVRQQAVKVGCIPMETFVAKELARLQGNGKNSNANGVRFTTLCHASRILILTHSFENSYSDIKACVEKGTPVYVHVPYFSNDIIRITSIDELNELCKEQKDKGYTYRKEEEFEKQFNILNEELKEILTQPCTWLGEQYTELNVLKNEFPNLEAFMLYVEAIINSIEDEGEWDLEVSTSLVLNRKTSVFTLIASSGEGKGLRTTTTSDRVGNWENYEVLLADILKKFLSLTFYKSVGIKPLKRVMTNGADYVPVCSTDDLPETEFYSTPFYVDEN